MQAPSCAALFALKSLLKLLTDKGIVAPEEVVEAIKDAIEALRAEGALSEAEMLEEILRSLPESRPDG
jgi:hypothetical protein